MREQHGHDEAESSKRKSQAQPAETGVAGPQPAGVPSSAAHILHLQRTLGNAAVARMIGDEPEEVQRSAVHGVLRSPGRPLDEPVRADMEARFGADFSDVRLHTGPAAQRSATEIGARAYTSGNHIVIGEGGADSHTLAHELTHVVQQRSGPVAGTDNGNGLKVSDPSDRFEREAEATAKRVMGPSVERAFSNRDSASNDGRRDAAHRSRSGTVQRNPVTRGDDDPPAEIPIERVTIGDRRRNEFVKKVYEDHKEKTRPNGWDSNFAVLDYLDSKGNRKSEPRFNMGGGCYHSEETIVNILTAMGENYTPLQLFTDRSPCEECKKITRGAFRNKLTGKDAEIPVYYIVDNKLPRHEKKQAIEDWWR
jgi:uncharacterized protein DUF4157